MRIGIINAGNIGGRLARAWVAAGHDVMVSKDGDAKRLAPLTRDLDPDRLTTGMLREAAAFGDVALFSVYWPHFDSVLEEVGDELGGKVVIETMNPLGVTEDFVHYHDDAFMRDRSTAEELQRRIPKARVVKAFSTLPAPVLEAGAWSTAPIRASVFYCGDDDDAKGLVRRLVQDIGLRPINAGPIKSARQLEQLGVLLHHIANAEYGGDQDLIRLGFGLLEASPGPVTRERDL